MKKGIYIIIFTVCTFNLSGQENLGERIKSVLQPYVNNKELPGIVTIIADREKILFQENMGYSDIYNEKNISPKNIFWMASQTKPVTGVAVMMLVDEGKLDLDEPINTYLPGLGQFFVRRLEKNGIMVDEVVTKPITLRHLLSHTSGMNGTGGVHQQLHKIDVHPLKISAYVSPLTPLMCEPGEKFIYSNQDIDVAAAIVEQVSGMSFEDFLSERIFKPLGMNSATFWPSEKQQKDMAIPYRLEKGELTETTVNLFQYPLHDRKKRFAEAGGGLFCSAEDMLKFYQMVANKGVYRGKRYLSLSGVEQLGAKQTGENIPDIYGLGWVGTDLFMGHAGAYGTDSKIYKQKGIIAMYFVQSAELPKEAEALAAFEKVVREYYDLK